MISQPTYEQLLDRSHRFLMEALSVFDKTMQKVSPPEARSLVAIGPLVVRLRNYFDQTTLASDFGDRGRALLHLSLGEVATTIEALATGVTAMSAWVANQWSEDFPEHLVWQMPRREARHLTEAYDGLLEALTAHLDCAERYLTRHLSGIFCARDDHLALGRLSGQIHHLGQNAREARKTGLHKLLRNSLSFETAVRACERMGMLRTAPRNQLTGSVIAIHEHTDPDLARAVVEDDFGKLAILSVHAHAPLNIGARVRVTAPASDGQPFRIARAPDRQSSKP